MANKDKQEQIEQHVAFLRSGIGKFLEHFESKKLLHTKQREALNALIAPNFQMPKSRNLTINYRRVLAKL